jgi:hypothetical protein
LTRTKKDQPYCTYCIAQMGLSEEKKEMKDEKTPDVCT